MSYRYIIVGAGSAGCVLANRLSHDPQTDVLLIESGMRDVNPFIHMPAGLAKLVHNSRIKWDFYTEPEPQLNNRRLYWPRGRVLGGSSSINAMCYVRGQIQDYDEWARMGNTGWDFASVLPYFKKSERQQRGPSYYHGTQGPLSVEDLSVHNALSETFIEAAMATGWNRNDDFNSGRQAGVGLYQVTQQRGRRCSSAVGYLRPARARKNLTVLTNCHVERLVLNGSRAVGVEYVQEGKRNVVHSDGEVLLCCGAIQSPQVLMLSGIGPPDVLQSADVPVRVELSGVGENLQDHLDICTLFKSRRAITYDFNPLQELSVALRYLFTSSGPGASNVAEAGGFVSSQYAEARRPDIQLHFVPAQLDDHGRNRLPGHGFTMHACFLQPRSRGHIRLRTARALDAPLIRANYLQEPEDLERMIEAVRISREIFYAAPFDPFRGEEIFPGNSKTSRDDIVAFIRAKAETVYHPVGTCRMGTDPLAVVDPLLRVRGVDGLRVVDASVMPKIVSGNTNAPTIMIAEKAADLILAAPEQSVSTEDTEITEFS